MIRMSVLKNYPVISHNRQIGVLQNLALDATKKRVDSLIVSCGMRGKRLVPIDEIRSISDGFVMIGEAVKYRRGCEKDSCLFLTDSQGLFAGRIIDYAIEKSSLKVIAIEMIQGYLPRDRRNRIWVYDYVRRSSVSGEIVIPACLGSELIYSSGGDS